MPDSYGNKVRVSVYVDPDICRKIDSFRNPNMSRSEFYAMVMTEALGTYQ